ncbi:unnamed protein product [Ophioblennius macclurei]
MDWFNENDQEVSVGVTSKPFIFTFVPVVQKLPIKSIISDEWRAEALTSNKEKIVAASPEKTTPKTMSDRAAFKAERVFIKESVEGGAGNLKPDYVSLSKAEASPPVRAQSENTPGHADAWTASMETAVDKHGGISQRRGHNASGHAEVSLGPSPNTRSASEDRTSPTNSVDLFPTPASSRESILSEGSDKERSWSAAPLSSVTSPASFSRTVSPCSSVRSGVFSPAVIQIKRHCLAPGSSLVNIPPSCFSSCDSLSSSYPQSPPPRPRHRPPLTRLSLLTAILRKGRLPVLSSALQRPYTPCWPINPVTLSFCNACSAASSVASIPLEFSSRFSSSTSIDSQSQTHREANRCTTAPPAVRPSEPGTTCAQTQVQRCAAQIRPSSAPKWERVTSPSPGRSITLPKVPVPLFSSKLQSVPSPKCDESDCVASKKVSHLNLSNTRSPEPKPSSAHTFLKSHAENPLKKLISSSLRSSNEPDNAVPQKLSRQPNSSLSRLHSLSQRLRSPPVCPPPLHHHAHSCATISPARAEVASPPPPPPGQNTIRGCESERSRMIPKSVPPPRNFSEIHCLSPSRYTPMAFSGWPSPASTPTPTPPPTHTPTPTLTHTSSPAPPVRDFSPSPSFSLRSTPSPRPGSGISDYGDRDGKKRKTHKIKLSYKSLAAIPTNTLLLDQQAIDDEIERQDSRCDMLDRAVADTHAEMCSPAQRRQQSDQLYAVIDEILANAIPESSRPSSVNAGQQQSSSLPKSLGRETKYASLGSLYPSASERKLMEASRTKPGVIRPMTASPRLTVEDENLLHPNGFRQSAVSQISAGRKKAVHMSPEEARTGLRGKMWGEEGKPDRRSPYFTCDLQITEHEDGVSHPGKDASSTFSAAERCPEAFEAHI